ncbi:MAG: cyanophycinase [Acidobacteriota bacterium]
MNRFTPFAIPLLVLLFILLSADTHAQAQKDFEYHVIGSSLDVKTKPTGGLALLGGGTDVDAAFQWMIERSGGGDFVVLRASGTSAYNPYINKLGKVDSVETLIIKSREVASDPFVIEKIRNAEALFIAGGDQGNYINFWKGTPVQTAIQSLVEKHAPIGGTSAGLAVLGEFLFPALKDTVTSKDALANPFHERVILDKNFLALPHLGNLITDSHFVERDRMGRLLVFLARMKSDGWAKTLRAIAIDRETAVLIDAQGQATLGGKNTAYFLNVSTKPERMKAGDPLTYRNISVYRLNPEGTFNLKKWQGTGGTSYRISVENGVLMTTQPDNRVY